MGESVSDLRDHFKIVALLLSRRRSRTRKLLRRSVIFFSGASHRKADPSQCCKSPGKPGQCDGWRFHSDLSDQQLGGEKWTSTPSSNCAVTLADSPACSGRRLYIAHSKCITKPKAKATAVRLQVCAAVVFGFNTGRKRGCEWMSESPRRSLNRTKCFL